VSALSGTKINIRVASLNLEALVEKNVISPGLGGLVREEGGLAEIIVFPDGITQDAQLTIGETPSGAEKRATALVRQNLVALGPAKDFVLKTQGSLTAATIRLPFKRSLIPEGRTIDDARIAFYDPTEDAWEVLDRTIVKGDILETNASHFSVYMPVLLMPDQTPGYREVFVFPNPATSPDEPTIRVVMGKVDEVQITIYDVTGQKVHSAQLGGGPTSIIDGQYVYDYTWSSPKASGTYFAVIHGKSAEGTVRGKAKFAVIR